MPKISVIIPVYNDPDGIQQTLQCVCDQTYSTDNYEVVVADNNSTDRTVTVAEEFSERYPDLVRITHEREIQSSYAARNTGIKESTGDVLAFIDADMTVGEDWLENISDMIETTDAAYIGCNVELFSKPGDNSIWSAYRVSLGFPIEHYLKVSNFAGAGCIVVKREVFNDVGLFDNTLVSGGDGEFGKRVADAGYSQHYAGHIEMRHPARSSFSALVSQAVRHGRGQTQVRQNYPHFYPRSIPSLRDFLPPHPFTFQDRLSNDVSNPKALLYWVIEWILKLCKAVGILLERFDK